MGVVNVTPDSFSDGGRPPPQPTRSSARRMLADGAAIVDVGGESTRPGRTVSRSTRSCGASCRCSRRSRAPGLDRHLEGRGGAARARARRGARQRRDRAPADPELAGVVAEADADLCLMHMLGEPRTMQDDPRYDDVVSEVRRSSRSASRSRSARGSRGAHLPRPRDRLRQDVEHNVELVRRLDELRALGRPVLVGCRARARAAPRRARTRPGALRRVSAPPSPRSSAAPRSSASTTCARTSRRSRRGRGRGAVHMKIELTVWSCSGTTVSRGGAARGQRSSSTSSSRSATAARTTIEDDGRLPTPGGVVREVSGGAAVQLLETLAAAVADELMASASRRARRGTRPQAGGRARRDGVEFAAVTVERPGDVGVRRPGREPRRPERRAARAAAAARGAGASRSSHLDLARPSRGRTSTSRRSSTPWPSSRPSSRARAARPLLAVERELGRERGEGPRWGPRTIDLDLLLYGDEIVGEPGLTRPAPASRTSDASCSSRSPSSIPALVVPGAAPWRTCSRGYD